MHKDTMGYFTKRDVHMQRFSLSLIKRKTEMGMEMSYYYICIRMVKIK